MKADGFRTHASGLMVRPDGMVARECGRLTFGSDNGTGYLSVQQRGKALYVHRLVLEAFVGPCPEGFQCDHKNGVRSDNRLANLEWVASSVNTRRAVSRNGAAGYYWRQDRGKWQARLYRNGKNRSLGCFKSKAEARAAYLQAVVEVDHE